APGTTGLQANVSSECIGGHLGNELGPTQGKAHPDGNDWLRGFTLMVLLVLFPPGSDGGDFLLYRPGLYVREQNTAITWAVFKGNDVHSGSAPEVHNVAESDAWRE
ncbi:hypothetical protein FA95DRAFT_1478698, partial [Auriscalpium vulgare]